MNCACRTQANARVSLLVPYHHSQATSIHLKTDFNLGIPYLQMSWIEETKLPQNWFFYPLCMRGNTPNVMTCKRFRVTGHLWGESTGQCWIPLTKGPITRGFAVALVFAWTWSRANNPNVWWFERPLCSCVVIVIHWSDNSWTFFVEIYRSWDLGLDMPLQSLIFCRMQLPIHNLNSKWGNEREIISHRFMWMQLLIRVVNSVWV